MKTSALESLFNKVTGLKPATLLKTSFNRNQIFSMFEHVLPQFCNVMNIMNLALGKLYFASIYN